VSRWLEETGGTRGQSYAEAFRALAASGKDVHGEAAYVGALVPPGSRVLDAGCGTGRVAIELARRGYDVVGVDSDPSMLAVARETAPELTWVDGDLATLSLEQRFDLVVAAGNVMVFLAPGTEAEVVARMAAHVVPGGLLVSGWRTDRLAVATYDAWARSADLEPVARHATWDGDPWTPESDWCVAVDRASDAPSP
jgi:SAM-dependent methyltransferase